MAGKAFPQVYPHPPPLPATAVSHLAHADSLGHARPDGTHALQARDRAGRHSYWAGILCQPLVAVTHLLIMAGRGGRTTSELNARSGQTEQGWGRVGTWVGPWRWLERACFGHWVWGAIGSM